MKLIATKSIDADFYIDTMIVQTLVSNTSLYKTADMGGIGSALIEQVKHYVDNNIGLAIEIDENDQFRNWLFASANQFKTQDDGWIKVSSILKLEKHSLTKKHSIKVYATGNIYENYVDDLKYMVIVPFQ